MPHARLTVRERVGDNLTAAKFVNSIVLGIAKTCWPTDICFSSEYIRFSASRYPLDVTTHTTPSLRSALLLPPNFLRLNPPTVSRPPSHIAPPSSEAWLCSNLHPLNLTGLISELGDLLSECPKIRRQWAGGVGGGGWVVCYFRHR